MPVKRNRKPSPFVAEDFYELNYVLDPRIAPDGKTIAYVVQKVTLDRKGYQSALWLCDVAGKAHKRFTSGEKRDHSPRWSPDGKRIAFVSNRSGRNQLWLIELDGGEAEQLTYLPNGAAQPAWSPDGKKLLFVSYANEAERAAQDKEILNQPLPPDEQEKLERERKQQEEEQADPRVIERTIYRAGTEYFDDRRAHLYVLDLADRRILRVTRGDVDYVNPCWSPNGKYLYCGAKRTGDTDESLVFDLLRLPAKGGAPKRLKQVRSWSLEPLPSPNGKHIAYLDLPEHHASAQNAQLMVIPAGGGKPKRLAAQVDADFHQVEWSPNSQSVYFTSPQRGSVGLYSVSLGSERVQQHLAGNRMVHAFSLADKADQAAFLSSTPEYPSDLFACDMKGRGEKRLTRVNVEFIKRKHIQPVEEFWYESHDGTQVQGWLLKPPGFRRDRKYPLALEIHGGPHVMWSPSETTMWHEWQMLASAGYVVFFCNPRGSDGYGLRFKDAIHQDWGTYPLQDILSGVDEVLKQGFVDPKRLCVTGGSYGGYMTAWLISHDERFAAAVSQRGVYDLISFYGTTDVPRLIEWEFDAHPWEDPMRLWDASPIAHVKRIRTPLLILHSDLDFRAPIPTAEGLYMALRKLGRKVKFVRFPNEGHELSRSGRPKRIVKRLQHILGWFNEHAKK